MRDKAVGGLRRLMGSLWRPGERGQGSEETTREGDRRMSLQRDSVEVVESVRSGEQLAEEYRELIGDHPHVAGSKSNAGRARDARNWPPVVNPQMKFGHGADVKSRGHFDSNSKTGHFQHEHDVVEIPSRTDSLTGEWIGLSRNREAQKPPSKTKPQC